MISLSTATPLFWMEWLVLRWWLKVPWEESWQFKFLKGTLMFPKLQRLLLFLKRFSWRLRKAGWIFAVFLMLKQWFSAWLMLIPFQLIGLLKVLLAQLLDYLLFWIVFFFVGLQGATMVLLIVFVNGVLSTQLMEPFSHLLCHFFCKLSESNDGSTNQSLIMAVFYVAGL